MHHHHSHRIRAPRQDATTSRRDQVARAADGLPSGSGANDRAPTIAVLGQAAEVTVELLIPIREGTKTGEVLDLISM